MGKCLFLIMIALFFVSYSKTNVTKEDTITKDVKVEQEISPIFQQNLPHTKKEVKQKEYLSFLNMLNTTDEVYLDTLQSLNEQGHTEADFLIYLYLQREAEILKLKRLGRKLTIDRQGELKIFKDYISKKYPQTADYLFSEYIDPSITYSDNKYMEADFKSG